MPTARIPLIGTTQPRTYQTEAGGPYHGQQFVNCVFEVFANPVTGKQKIKVNRRPDWKALATLSGMTDGKAVLAWLGIGVSGLNGLITAWDASNSSIYKGSTLLGTITGTCTGLIETFVSTTAAVLISSSDSTGWYYMSDAGTGSPTFTGDTTSGSAIVTNIASTTGMYTGQALSGTGIAAGARILTVDSGTQITMTANATASNAGVTITRTSLAKIIASAFPGNAGKTIVGTFAAMDGYAFILTDDGLVYNSNLNSISAWTANNYIPSQLSPDRGVGLIRHKNLIVAFGKASTEWFENAGNPSGSVLRSVKDAFSRRGAASADGILNVEDSLAFIASGDQSGVGVFLFDGFSPKKISDEAVDLILTGLTATSCGLAFSAADGRRLIFVMTSGDSTTTPLVYDMDLNLWSLWIGGLSTYAPWKMNTSFLGSGVATYAVAKGIGQIQYNQGSGNTYDAQASRIITEMIDFGTENRKVQKSFRLVGDQFHTGNALPLTSSVQFDVSWSDDDGVNWNTASTVTMGPSENTKLTRGGMFRRRMYRIEPTTDARSGLEAMEIDYEVCVS